MRSIKQGVILRVLQTVLANTTLLRSITRGRSWRSWRSGGGIAAWIAPVALLIGITGGGARAQAPENPRAAAQAIVREARRLPQSNGVEELKAIKIGGIQQWISVRGRDRRNPILLFIHGGPGSPEMPASWLYQRPLEDYFTVVQWDQRGAGKTLTSNDSGSVNPTISVEKMISDGEQVVDYIRNTYGKDKIFIIGHSWGTVIGLRIAQTHPEWLHAYIGMGQVIDAQENEQLGYQFALRQAHQHGDQQAVKELEALAPYPGPPGALSINKIITQRKWVIRFGGLTWGRSDFDYEQNLKWLSPDYTDADLAAPSNEYATLLQLLPRIQQIDFRSTRNMRCPIYIFAGRYDYETPSELAAKWLNDLTAPTKQIFWFEHSAHMMQQEQPGAFFLHLVRDIRPLAVRVGDAAPDDAPGTGG